jgi:hypothetical protein
MATIPDLLRLLFASFPASGGDSEAQLAAYALALDGHDMRDVETAVRKLVRGEYDWHNPAFAPSSAVLGSAVIQERDVRLLSERRAKLRQPALPPPDIEKTPEQRERARQMMQEFVERQAAIEASNQADTYEARRRQFECTNARFKPDLSDHAVMERLLGYSTGSPESEEHAA